MVTGKVKFEEKVDKDATLECCFICFRNIDNEQSRYTENESCENVATETDTRNKAE